MTSLFKNTPYMKFEVSTAKCDDTLYYDNIIITEINKAKIQAEHFDFKNIYELLEKHHEPQRRGQRYEAVITKDMDLVHFEAII